MSDNTKIQWAKATWNPVTGCSPVSEGCLNCYATRMAKHLAGRFGYPKDDPFRVTFHPDRLDQPLKWKKPRRIFTVSMGDLFHENLNPYWIASILGIISFCQLHTFLLLTKRPDQMNEFFLRYHEGDYKRNLNWWMNEACLVLHKSSTLGIRLREKSKSLPLPNLWLGVTAENQKRADERIPILLQIPAAVRFVSVEPMLGPIDLLSSGYLADHEWEKGVPGGINWVICGAETGPGARPMAPDWSRDLRNQCKSADIPFFMKAMSNKEPIPDDLMIRKYPS